MAPNTSIIITFWGPPNKYFYDLGNETFLFFSNKMPSTPDFVNNFVTEGLRSTHNFVSP